MHVYVSKSSLFFSFMLSLSLESLFGKQDALRVQLENELIGLNPNDFDNIQDLFTKLKSLRLQLKQCKIKEDSQLILSILAKLGPNYLVFVSTFYDTRDALRTHYTMSSLDDFSSQLTQEKTKLVQMGRSQALVASQSSTNQNASHGKGKIQKHKDSK